MLAENVRPTEEMVRKAYAKNDDGAGIAWREVKGKTTEVVWQKGLNLEQMIELVATAPMPFVAHFRIASCGGARKSLCHPFAIDENASTFLSGRTKGMVLFHNGHWGEWKKVLLETSIRFGKKIPDGKFSDTRAMAFICAVAGINFMELIEEKGIAFGPDRIEMFWGSGWYKVQDVWCSNTGFTTQTINHNDPTGAYSTQGTVYGGTHASYNFPRTVSQCLEKKCYVSHNIDADGYCPQHSRTRPSVTTDADDVLPVVKTHVNKPQQQQVHQPGKNINPLAQWQRAQSEYAAGNLSNKKFKRAQRAYEKSQYRAGLLSPQPPVVVKNH
jgi:hypothetical protein